MQRQLTRAPRCAEATSYRRRSSRQARSFVGRAAELALLRAAWRRTAGEPVIHHVCGPAGIGKSALLRRAADEAEQAGRPVLRLSGADLCSEAIPVLSGRPVVLIDDLEAGEPWLRDLALSAEARGTVFIVAGRQQPSPAYPMMVLAPLSVAESERLVSGLGVPDDKWDDVWSAGMGNPLALRAAASAVVTGAEFIRRDDLRREVAVSLFHRLIGEIPSGAHRRALEVCALAVVTTEDLLRATIPTGDAVELFAWLRGRPFMASGARGLFPSDIVRMVVRTELRWRDAQAFAALHDGVTASC